MTESASKTGDDHERSEQDSVAAVKLSSTRSLRRENRWKRRDRGRWNTPTISVFACVLLGLVFAAILAPKAETTRHGIEGEFANAVFEAFPEADPANISTLYDDDLPRSATLHLPAYMIEPALGIGNPFARLGAEFGGVERTLSGVEMASRLEQIGQAALPSDLIRCHSYEIGEISSEPDAPRRTRALHLHLNPGC